MGAVLLRGIAIDTGEIIIALIKREELQKLKIPLNNIQRTSALLFTETFCFKIGLLKRRKILPTRNPIPKPAIGIFCSFKASFAKTGASAYAMEASIGNITPFETNQKFFFWN